MTIDPNAVEAACKAYDDCDETIWNSIMDIRITLARRAYDVTVEEAREL